MLPHFAKLRDYDLVENDVPPRSVGQFAVSLLAAAVIVCAVVYIYPFPAVSLAHPDCITERC